MTKEEAIQRIKDWNLEDDDMEVLAAAIPELKESEDEKIRKHLMFAMKHLSEESQYFADISKYKILAWLEKQGEKVNPCENEDEKIKNCLIGAMKGISEENLFFIDIPKYKILTWLEKQSEQKSTWSKEDEQNLNASLGYIDDEYLRRWLKDIIHVKYDKPTWSEEDEKKSLEIKYLISDYKSSNNELCSWIDELKNRVQPQSQWKPTEEQMDDFWAVLMEYGDRLGAKQNPSYKSVKYIYEQLKKL